MDKRLCQRVFVRNHSHENVFHLKVHFHANLSFMIIRKFQEKRISEKSESQMGLGLFRVYVSPRIYVLSCCYFSVSKISPFHVKSFARGLALKQRHKTQRNSEMTYSLIKLAVLSIYMLQTWKVRCNSFPGGRQGRSQDFFKGQRGSHCDKVRVHARPWCRFASCWWLEKRFQRGGARAVTGNPVTGSPEPTLSYAPATTDRPRLFPFSSTNHSCNNDLQWEFMITQKEFTVLAKFLKDFLSYRALRF